MKERQLEHISLVHVKKEIRRIEREIQRDAAKKWEKPHKPRLFIKEVKNESLGT